MKPLLLTLNLLIGADSATTHIGLRMGAQELFLPTQNPAFVHVISAGQAVSLTWTLARWEKRHPKLVRWIGWTVVGIRAGAVVNNIYQIQKGR